MHDSLTLSGANELARKIRAYWAAKGKVVTTHVEAVKTKDLHGFDSSHFYQIRSDMVGGLPC